MLSLAMMLIKPAVLSYRSCRRKLRLNEKGQLSRAALFFVFGRSRRFILCGLSTSAVIHQ
jgi:hypothetical protein